MDDELPTMSGETGEGVIDVLELREELIHMAEAGDIKYTPKYIKKSNRGALERIKRDSTRKQTDEANEFISDNIITKVSELIKSLEIVDEPDGMEKELKENRLVKRDLKNIIGYITPYIPLIGLLCGGIIVGKHIVVNKYPNKNDGCEDQSPQSPHLHAVINERIQ